MHNAIKIPLIILGAGLAMLLMFAGVVAIFYYSTQELEVTEADKSLVVGPEALQPYFDDYHAISESIRYRKVKYIDGQIELDMEYDVEDIDQPYMSVVITDSRRKSEAISNYLVSWNAMVAVYNAYDTDYDIVEDNNVISLGDRSRFAYIKYQDQIVGNLILFVSGSKLYELTMTGFYIEDGEIWSELLADKPAMLANFK